MCASPQVTPEQDGHLADQFRSLDRTVRVDIAAELNGGARQTLGFKTPSEALAEVLR